MLDLLDKSTLAEAREAAGLSRTELAAKAGVDHATIWRIEEGRMDPRLGTWAQIVRAVMN